MLLRPQPFLLTSLLSNPGSPPPIPNLHATLPHSGHLSATIKPCLRDTGRLSPLGNSPATWGLASLEPSAQSGCGFKALRAASPPQNLPNSLSLRLGLEVLDPSKLGAGLGASQYQPPHLPGTS